MTSFYLKYRPQRIADVDLKSVREFLERLVKSGRTHHAYLFAGPRGTGKTSAARILAKIVNCKQQETSSKRQEMPCNKCENCLAITRGNFPDLIEIDAASNRGIDDVRALRETVALAPIQGKVKVYLIDEVHMLTTEAFNALLKTLEEPPDGVMFILATTEPDKLPETVISRCIRVDFGRAATREIIGSLEKIVKTEKLNVDEAVLEELARVAQGSFRDAQKMLEQIVTGREKQKISVDMVTQSGAGKLLEYLLAKQRTKALEEIESLHQTGANWKNVVLDLIEKLRIDVLDQGEGWKEKKELLERLVRAGSEIKEAVIPQLPLELLVIEWCQGENPKFEIRNPKLEKTTVPARSTVHDKVKFEDVQAKWQEILVRLKPKNHSLAGLLRSSKPTNVDGDKLVIEVFYQFHLDQLKQEKFRQLVEEAVAEVFAFPLRLEYILGERQEGIQRKQAPEAADEAIVKAAEEIFGG